ncbi:MAG TPA: hypothetical protein VL832_13195 [Puia sp.]|jgi:hypothetical protein|nr:hypothetical protein [Puia sp.]
MSLNNIELGSLLITELYRDNLLATETPPVLTRSPAAPPPVPQPAAARPAPSGSPVGPAAAPASGSNDSVSPVQGYKVLGNNRRKITILVHAPGVAFLPDDQLNFLTRMLEACKMNVGDVAIVNQANHPVNSTALKQQLQPAVILLFGMEPTDIRLPMNFPPFKIQAYDACTYLCAPSLEELVKPGDESKLLKSKLWMCLKTLFEI